MTETRTYTALTGTEALGGFKGLRFDTRYTGVSPEDGTVLVAVVGVPMGTGVKVSSEDGASGFRSNYAHTIQANSVALTRYEPMLLDIGLE
jgi:hypothetical protein